MRDDLQAQSSLPYEGPSAGDSLPQSSPQPPPEPWRLRDLLLLVPFAFVALIGSYLLVAGGYVALKPIAGWHAPVEALKDNTFFLLILQSTFYGLLLGYLYLVVVLGYRQPFAVGLKWRRLTAKQKVAYSLGGVLLALIVQFLPPIFPESKSFPLERLFSSPPAAYAVGAFAILIAPFMEELIFRGVLFSAFERLGGLSFAVLGTALLFAGLHVPEYWGAWNHVLMIIVVGLAFSSTRGFTGSLAPSVFMHLAYNANQMVMLFFGTHYFRTLHGFVSK